MSEVIHMLDEVSNNLTSVYRELRDKPPSRVDAKWWSDKLDNAYQALKREDYQKGYNALELMLEMVGKTHPKLKETKRLMKEIGK